MTCYPDLEIDIRSAGAEFVNRDVVLDGSLVTVRGWPDNGPWMREFVRLLKATYPTRTNTLAIARPRPGERDVDREAVLD